MANNLAMHIGKRIQRAMKDQKVTTRAMATHCGVTPGAISNWFSSGRISKENLAKAATLLKIDLDELITGDSPNKFSQDQHVPTVLHANESPHGEQPTLAQSIQVLSQHLMEMDATTRRRAGRLLAELADDPRAHVQITQMLEAAIRSGQSGPTEPVEEEKKFIYKKQHPVEPWSPMTAERRQQNRREG